MKVINLLPHTIDVHINGIAMIKKLSPENESEYLYFPTNSYQLEVFVAGETNVLKSKKKEVPSNIYSIFFITTTGIIYFPTDQYLPDDETKLRIIHLSNKYPVIDVRVKYGDIVFPNVRFESATDYLGLTPMTVELKLTDPKSKHTFIILPKIKLNPNKIYSLILTDDSTKFDRIKTLLIKD